MKPNKAQKILLLVGLGGIVATVVYLKYFSGTTPTATGATASFTGNDNYNTYYAADGNKTGQDRCAKLTSAYDSVKMALSNHANLTPMQITAFKHQELQILSELQSEGCKK